jgi:ATP-dependent DNA helicase RecG
MPERRAADSKPSNKGPRAAMLRMGLATDTALALHLPLRYEDETRLTPPAEWVSGEPVHIEGLVAESHVEQRGRRQLLARLVVAEGETVLLRFLNFYPSQQKLLAPGTRLRVRGELRGGLLGHELVHPTVRKVEEGEPLARSLTPVYPSSAGLPQAYLRRAIESALQRVHLPELLRPEQLEPLPQHNGQAPATWPSLRDAVLALHHPAPDADAAALEDRSHPAWQRLKFEELLAQQLAQAQARAARALLRAPALAASKGPQSLAQRLQEALPFKLTKAQHRVSAEIAADLQRGQPMHRLLQGDVGAGKTVVAALAAAHCIDAGWQCALMAPTEILAEQHFGKLVQWLQPLGLQVAWLSGSRKGKGRREALLAIAEGRAALVVGTHAVIEGDVVFARLGLAFWGGTASGPAAEEPVRRDGGTAWARC